MSDRMFFSLAVLAAVLLIALAAVWPQGLGARSPGPFARPLAQSTVDRDALAGLRPGK